MTLIIAEKPGLARSIADAIPYNTEKMPGAIKKGDYIITWAYGHLLQLKEPQDYDPAYKEWRMDALPIYFPKWGKKVNEQSFGGRGGGETPAQRLETIGKYLREADMVVHAGDPDDEGQYLIDEIIEYFDYQGPVMRLATANTSEAALSRALGQMTDNASHIKMGQSAYARSVADLMVGVNLSRYFSLNNPEVLLSIGRVQTPALGLVVRRDYLIENHVMQHYYIINADVDVKGNVVSAKYVPNKKDPRLEDGRILSTDVADEIMSMIRSMPTSDCVIETKTEQEPPPLPFNLVKLQSYSEKHWGYTPKETLAITQSLRDNYNAISYNRTDCQYLSSDQFAEAPTVMNCVIQNIRFKPKQLDMSIKSRAFDDSYVQSEDGNVAHLAIIPQAVNVDLNKLTEQEKNVYMAICKYYMAQFLPPATKQKTSLTIKTPDGGELKANSTIVLEKGYLSIFKDADEDESSILSNIPPSLYNANIVDVSRKEADTKPPARYTQASLGEDMTKIAKYVEDPRIKEILIAKDKGKRGENGSIGTEATRADIINTLLERGYIEPDGKKIKSTPLGRELYRILPDELRNPDMTALWWCVQEDIKNGHATTDTLIQSVLEMIKGVIHTEYPKIDMSIVPDKYKRKGRGREPLGICPRCGNPVIEGKLGYGCSGYKEGCKFVIWKQSKMPMLQKVKFSAADAKKLLEGKTVHKSGLVKKAGGTFSANLKMQDDPTSPYQGTNIVIDSFDNAKGGEKKHRGGRKS